MKEKIILLSLLISVLALTSCASVKKAVRDNRTPIETAVDYSKVASYFACAQILDMSKSSGDKRAKALIIYDISIALSALSATEPTSEDIEAAILQHTPDKPHWELLAGELSRIYLNLYESVQSDEDYALLASVVNEIAEGCLAAARPIIEVE